jgi:ubiquinone biosynthesis protein UbiJ
MADRLTGKPIHLDISDLPMKLVLLPQEQIHIGPSGKSFLPIIW